MAAASCRGEGRKAGSGKALIVDVQALFRELQKVPKSANGSMTLREIIKATGLSPYMANKLVGEACEKGLARGLREPRKDRCGVFRVTSVYVFGKA